MNPIRGKNDFLSRSGYLWRIASVPSLISLCENSMARVKNGFRCHFNRSNFADICGGVLVAIVGIIAKSCEKVSKFEKEIDLKHKLVDSGMAPDEIETILNAGKEGSAQAEENDVQVHVKSGLF